jgi:arylsulfatase A-like enzyme
MRVRPPQLAALGLAVLALVWACAPRGADPDGRGVLVIAIDALRADHTSVLGYDRPTTPTLEALAREGVVFTEAFTSAPQMLPAHVALLTGCEPLVARRFLPGELEGLAERRWRIPSRVGHLALEFLTAGYATAAFVDDPRIAPVHGFGPGFQDFVHVDAEQRQAWEGSQPERISRHFLDWLRSRARDQSWFAYLQFSELERFWTAPPDESTYFFPPRPELSTVPPVGNTDSVLFAVPRSHWRGVIRTLGQYEAAYDGAIRALDGQLERLLAQLRRSGWDESTTIVVVGSYGIQFGESGLFLRGGRYTPADLRVPWVLRPAPASRAESFAARPVSGVVSLLDLAPTLLDLEDLPVPGGTHGLSQAAVVREPGASVAERPFVFASCGIQEGCALIGDHLCLEYLLPAGTADAQLRRSWFGEWRDLEVAPSQRFYDWRVTPFPPLEPGILTDAEDLSDFRAACVGWLRDLNDTRVFLQAAPGRSGLPAETIQHLREEGYVGALR